MDIYNKIYNERAAIIYSIVIPVFNQEDIIVDNLKSIINNTLTNFEILIILDYCFDNTEKKILNFLESYENTKDDFIQIKIFKNELIPLFETKCDNIGFKNSVGKYCLEIQADMKMTELGYNLHLTKPFNLFKNIIAVSGRCSHNLYSGGGIGKLGVSIEKTLRELNINKNKFYVFDTCNRGPLLLDREKLEELNFLDEENYFLNDSDHDLMARAYLQKKYICGYVPIDFEAPLDVGSTRNTKTYNLCEEYFINKNERERLEKKFSLCQGIKQYRSIWHHRQPSTYDI
jgi:glycosyltransferase involved in cell wall biosynthesis